MENSNEKTISEREKMYQEGIKVYLEIERRRGLIKEEKEPKAV